MSASKRFWLPYASYDMKNIKIWLEEKAEDGYILKKMKRNFPIFEEVERGTSVKYHLEPTTTNMRKPPEEIMETRKQRGWRYAGTIHDFFHVYYAEKDTKDFYYQSEDIKHALQEKLRIQKKELIMYIPLTILPFMIDLLGSIRFMSPFLWLFLNFSWLHVTMLIFFFFSGLFKLLSYLKLKKYVASSDSQTQTESSSIVKVFSVSGGILLVGLVIFVLYQLFWGSTIQNDSTWIQQEKGYPMQVLLLAEKDAHIQNQEIDQERNFYVETKRSFLLTKQLSAYYLIDYGFGYERVSVDYYRGLTAGARKVFQNVLLEKIAENEYEHDTPDEIEGIVLNQLRNGKTIISLLSSEEHLIVLYTPIEIYSDGYLLNYVEAFKTDLSTLDKRMIGKVGLR